MVSSVINPKGTARTTYFSRTDEFLFFVFVGSASVPSQADGQEMAGVRWRYLRRTDIESRRGTVKGGKAQFYPVFVEDSSGLIAAIGDAIPPGVPRSSVPPRPGCTTVFPIREEDGMEMNWGLTGPSLQRALEAGYVRVSKGQSELQAYVFAYLTAPNIRKVEKGELLRQGRRSDGSWIVVAPHGTLSRPTTNWRNGSHEAGAYGTTLLRALLPGRTFPFPKSLYAVEDALRFFVGDKPNGVILDFFAGSGTTSHAIARLNRQDGGRRQCISVTNNEVSADEATSLRKKGLRPGDPEWEALGIFEHITRPRITAAMTGESPEGEPVKGAYKFTDEFPMAAGFEENIEFVELTYLDPDDIELDLAFAGIAPLLWMRAGATGPVLDECLNSSGRRKPSALTEQYGVLFNADRWRSFVEKLPATATTAFVVTDSQATFAGIGQP